MPVAAALPSIIGIGGSAISGWLGSRTAKKSAQALMNAGMYARDNYLSTGAGIQQHLIDAYQGGQNYVWDATRNAQGDLAGATSNANTRLGDVWKGQQDVLSPYMQVGQTGASYLQELMSPEGLLRQQFKAPTAEEVEATPGYRFQLEQGMKALNRSAAGAGQLNSGGTSKSLAQYTQGLASTYYQNAFNNALSAFNTNRQGALSTVGAAMQAGQFGASEYNRGAMNYGNLSAGNMMNSALTSGNWGINAGQFNANLGMRGTELAGQFGLRSVEDAMQAYLQGAGGYAAGIQGSGNAWQNGLNGIISGASNLATVLMGGGVNGVPPAGSPRGVPPGSMPPPVWTLPGYQPAPIAPPPPVGQSPSAVGTNRYIQQGPGAYYDDWGVPQMMY